MSSKFELMFITYPGMGHIVAMVEFAHHLINHDPRFSITILIITMPERMLVNTYIQSRAATSASTNIRFVHLPTLETPTPDHGSQTDPLCLISSFIEKHKPHFKQEITSLMATELDRRFVGLFIDMFCTSMVDVASELDIPCYLYFPSPATFLGFMLHLPILDTQLTTELVDLDTELVVPSFVNPVPPSVLPSIALKKDGYSCFLYHARRYLKQRVLLLIHLVSFSLMHLTHSQRVKCHLFIPLGLFLTPLDRPNGTQTRPTMKES